MRNLHIIMPMAGEGSRFIKEGWTTPKPLIELEGKPFFLHAIDSVRLEDILMKYSFIVRKEHIDNYNIDQGIKNVLPDANIFSVEKTTRGALETCLMAKEAIDPSDAIIIMDCDLEFSSRKFNEIIRDTLKLSSEEARGGALVSFESESPKYSYAEIDDAGKVIRTAEKEVISNHALCGAYFFASGKEFLEKAIEMVDAPMEKPELYVSLLYNKLLKDHSTVYLAPMEYYRSFGTPEELEAAKNGN